MSVELYREDWKRAARALADAAQDVLAAAKKSEEQNLIAARRLEPAEDEEEGALEETGDDVAIIVDGSLWELDSALHEFKRATLALEVRNLEPWKENDRG